MLGQRKRGEEGAGGRRQEAEGRVFASPKNLAKFSLNSATRCLAYKYLVGSPIHTSLALTHLIGR